MTPQRPYFLRAFHEWLTDNDLTPHLMIDVDYPNVTVPAQHAQGGQLVLNVSYSATKGLLIDNDSISFSARFAGVSEDIWLPMGCVLGLYAKEDQSKSLFFDPSEYPKAETVKTSPKSDQPSSPFTVIK